MPSNKEIGELQKQYPNMRMWGVDLNSFCENPRLGDILVIPFYDVIDALSACEQRVEARTMDVVGPHNYKQGVKDGYAAGVQDARDAVESRCRYSEFIRGVRLSEDGDLIDRAGTLAAIDALRGES